MSIEDKLEMRMERHLQAQSQKKNSVVTKQADPLDLAKAAVSPRTLNCLISSELIYGDPAQAAIFTTPPQLQGFPTEGNSFVVLSSGNASEANIGPACQNVASTSYGLPLILPTDPFGDPTGTGYAYDVVVLRLQFKLSNYPGILTFEWKLASEEGFPPGFGEAYNDYFRANVSTTIALNPVNIALFPGTLPANVTNAATVPFVNCPNDIIYNYVVSNAYTASYDLSAFGGQSLTLDLIVGDLGDQGVDTAVFIDNIRISGCETRGISVQDMSAL
jgi:hypothetical protein